MESETADDSGKRKDKQRIYEVRENDCTVALKCLHNKKRQKETFNSAPSLSVFSMLSASTCSSILLGNNFMASLYHLYIKAPLAM